MSNKSLSGGLTWGWLMVGVALGLLTVAGSAEAAPRVLLCVADSGGSGADFQTRLQGTNAFAVVDLINCASQTPTVATLKTYDVVMTWDASYYSSATTLGSNLADYFDQGGAVVVAQFAAASTYNLGGRWLTDGYNCLKLATYSSASATFASMPKMATPISQGVIGLVARYRSLAMPATGAVSLWDYTDGYTAVCQLTLKGRPRIDLNIYPASSYLTETSPGDATRLVRNTLLYAAGGGLLASSPSSVTFPDTGTGVTADAITVTLTNAGTNPVMVSGFSISGTNASEFAITSAPTAPITIAPSAAVMVATSFSPLSAGMRNATLQIAFSGQTFTENIPLSGNGVGAKLVVTPNPIRLGVMTVGQNVTKMVDVANQGGGKISVTGASITLDSQEFSVMSGVGFPVALLGGADVMISVGFTPTVTGSRTGELTLTTNDPSNPTLKVPLNGTSGPPALTLDTASIAFPTVNVGATTDAQTIVVTNSGFSDLQVSAVSVGGMNPADFTLDPKGFPATLAPGVSGPFTVLFSPMAAGTRQATISVVSNAPTMGTKTVSLLGTATTAQLSTTPMSLDFGAIKVGAVSVAKDVTLTAAGTGAVRILAISPTGKDAAAFTQTKGMMAPFTLAPGTMQVLSYTCTPKTSGPLTASLTIMADIGTTQVPLACSGTAPMLTSTPAMVDFKSVGVGVSSPGIELKLSNAGTSDVTLGALTFGGADANDFSTPDAPTMGMKLAPGAVVSMHVYFTPTRGGIEAGSVSLASDDPKSPLTVMLTGQGLAAGLSATPLSLDFAMALVGTRAMLPVTLTNTGATDLVITSLSVTGAQANQFGLGQSAPLTLAKGASQDIAVSFSPTVGGSATGALSVIGKGLSPVAVTLRGMGVSASVMATPATLDFGPIVIGNTSQPQTVTFKSGAKVALPLAALMSSSPQFQIDPAPMAMMLAPGASVSVDVRFAPTAATTVNGHLQLSLEGGTQPITMVAATGRGVDAAPAAGCDVSAAGSAPTGGALSALAVAVALALLLAMRGRRTSGREG